MDFQTIQDIITQIKDGIKAFVRVMKEFIGGFKKDVKFEVPTEAADDSAEG